MKIKLTKEGREIARLSEVVESEHRIIDGLREALKEREEQLRQQDRLMQQRQDDHNFELNRLGARLSALEYALVMAHGNEGRLVGVNRALRRGQGQDSFALAVDSEEAGPTPMNHGLKFKRIGDRWELVIP